VVYRTKTPSPAASRERANTWSQRFMGWLNGCMGDSSDRPQPEEILRTVLGNKMVRAEIPWLPDALPAGVKRTLQDEGRSAIVNQLAHAGRVSAAMVQFGISCIQYEGLLDVVMQGEPGVKICRQTRNEAQHSVQELMEKLIPLHESPGKTGYYHKTGDFFKLILPAYFQQVAARTLDMSDEYTFIPPQVLTRHAPVWI